LKKCHSGEILFQSSTVLERNKMLPAGRVDRSPISESLQHLMAKLDFWHEAVYLELAVKIFFAKNKI